MLSILQNLASNVIRVLINTSNANIVWSARKDGGNALFYISENGPGIVNDNSSVLMQDNVDINGRNGFELLLVRYLAKAIGYRISVQSHPE